MDRPEITISILLILILSVQFNQRTIQYVMQITYILLNEYFYLYKNVSLCCISRVLSRKKAVVEGEKEDIAWYDFQFLHFPDDLSSKIGVVDGANSTVNL